jgi:hypothetical protein
MTNVVQRSSHGRAPRLCILSAAAILALLFVVPPPRPQGAMGLDAAARAFLQRCAVSHSLGRALKHVLVFWAHCRERTVW